jgi:uncharacterized membrane protein
VQSAPATDQNKRQVADIAGVIKHLKSKIPSDHGTSEVHSVNELHDQTLTLGQQIADGVARNMGSWRFIIIQSTLLLFWIALNVAELLFKPWDPYPFILLNLALSFQAAYAAPFIMMSQNRQSDKDRLAAEHDYCVNIRSDVRVAAVLTHLEAQDNVILSILRQLERVHQIQPDEDQLKAEARLQESQQYEKRILEQVVVSEEQKAGLKPI